MSEQSITAKLMQPFPREAIKTRAGGGNSRLSYVEGHTVIHRLIDATGNQFDLRVLTVEQKGDLLTALVELTIPGLGSRQHIGVQKVSERGGEDLVKGAVTDALKKAATLFGVGLELYGPDYGSDDAPAPRQPRPTRPERPATPRHAPPPGNDTADTLTDHEERALAVARDMAEGTPRASWGEIREHLRGTFETASKAHKVELKRRMAQLQERYYPDSLTPQEATR